MWALLWFLHGLAGREAPNWAARSRLRGIDRTAKDRREESNDEPDACGDSPAASPDGCDSGSGRPDCADQPDCSVAASGCGSGAGLFQHRGPCCPMDWPGEHVLHREAVTPIRWDDRGGVPVTPGG